MTTPLNPAYCTSLVRSQRWLNKIATSPDGCLLWTGYRVKGYGRIGIDNKPRMAHRVAYVAATGTDIPVGMTIDHLCRNRACVNPDHMEVVTSRENTLRGNTLAAAQVARTHCPQGHELSGDNLVASEARIGKRKCRECNRLRNEHRLALMREAWTHLGITKSEYVAAYGWSRGAAESVLNK